MMRNFRFAPGTSSLQKFPRVLAYPIPGRNRLLMPFCVTDFAHRNLLRLFLSKEIFRSPTPEKSVLVKCFPKETFICEIFHYEHVCPRLRAFLAAFSLSGNFAPQALQVKTSSAFCPIAPHRLHSLLISFPNTSINVMDCSLHFWVSRLLTYPFCHILTELLIFLFTPALELGGSFGR